MMRRRWPLAAAGALTMLLAAWVSASGPVGIFVRADLTPGQVDRAREAPVDESSDVAPPVDTIYHQVQPNDTLVNAIVWGLRLILIGIVAAVVLLIAREVWRRWQERAVPLEETTAFDTLPEALLETASVRMDELRSGTPTNAIVACWMRLEEEITAAGIPADSARTSTEVTTAVLRQYAVDAEALRELAALYREARFSRHDVTEAHRSRAADALTTIHVDLRRAVGKAAARV
jgi:Domain of unknown function (DUF4129)